MNLNRKTFFYSFFLTLSMMALILSYLIFLLPNLYLDNMAKSNVERAEAFHQAYLKEHTYPKALAANGTTSMIFRSEKNSDQIQVISLLGTAKIQLRDPDMIELLHYIQSYDFRDPHAQWDPKYKSADFLNAIRRSLEENFSITLQSSVAEFKQEPDSFQYIERDHYVMFVSTVEDPQNVYTNTMGVSQQDGALIMTYMPFSISKIEDIRNVVYASIPLILLGLTLLTVLSSLYFSRSIVNPIQKVASHIQHLSQNQMKPAEALELKTADEVEDLAHSIDAMYANLQTTYQALKEEHRKQELFLRASSHQLKTPVASSLLLIESMIDGIGKYQDHQVYLPKVKEQIQSIQKVIEDLLLINKSLDLDKKETLDIDQIIQRMIQHHQVKLEAKRQTVQYRGQSHILNSQAEYLWKLVDNLLVNAIDHSPEGTPIEIVLTDQTLTLTNHGHIPEEILVHIFQPFVTSKNHVKSGGLGLYICQKYAEAMGFRIQISQTQNQVKVELHLT